jgi:ATP-dependent protease ClpP protease subunit
MPNSKPVLHYCHAWQTADAGDEKADFKFPHHKTEGGPANLAACRNGLARLESANIPDGDRAGVKAHLQAHLDDGDKGGDDDGGKADDVARFPLSDEASWARAGQLGLMVGSDRARVRAVRARKLSDRAEFFRFTNTTGTDTARLDIFDEIGFWGVDASEFNRQLQAVGQRDLTVHINSPGGDVFDGIAITNMLRAHPGNVHVVIDGHAASAASFIAMAGKTVTAMPNSMVMIHDASGMCFGNEAETRDMADLLGKVSQNLASIYAGRAGGTADEWRAAMKAETWYTADEAVEAGLADRVGDTDTPSDVVAATDRWNFSFYNYDGRASAPPPFMPGAARSAVPVATLTVDPAVEAAAIADLVAERLTALIPPTVPPATAGIGDREPTDDPALGVDPVPTPAAAPADETALAARRAEDTTPVWNPDIFRQALKERAAQ